MADQIILAAMKRFMTAEQAEAAYQTIFTAYSQRLADVTVMTGKSTEGESAQAQVVVNKEDYKEWMECLEEILQEEDGTVTSGPVHTSFLNRFTET